MLAQGEKVADTPGITDPSQDSSDYVWEGAPRLFSMRPSSSGQSQNDDDRSLPDGNLRDPVTAGDGSIMLKVVLGEWACGLYLESPCRLATDESCAPIEAIRRLGSRKKSYRCLHRYMSAIVSKSAHLRDGGLLRAIHISYEKGMSFVARAARFSAESCAALSSLSLADNVFATITAPVVCTG